SACGGGFASSASPPPPARASRRRGRGRARREAGCSWAWRGAARNGRRRSDGDYGRGPRLPRKSRSEGALYALGFTRPVMRLSTRAGTLKPSPTLAIDAKAKELARAGVDVVNLGAGEPDFDTPKAVVEAAHAAALAGKTKYTATPGIAELRAAIAKRVGE